MTVRARVRTCSPPVRTLLRHHRIGTLARMGTAAAVMGDKIQGQCLKHLIPSASGTQPAGPLPFSAPLIDGLVATVHIGGKPAAKALDRAGFAVIASGLRQCVTGDPETGGQLDVKRMEKLFMSLA